MTVRELLTYIESVKPHVFPDSAILLWLNELEGRVQLDIFLMAPEETVEYTLPDDNETVLLVDLPHTGIYRYWLEAMIDFESGEYNQYQNSVELFNNAWNEFACWFAETQGTEGDGVSRGFYLSAYGIAVKHGYTGSEEEWLETLKGAPGEDFKYEDFTEEQLAALRGDVVQGTLDQARSYAQSAEESAGAAAASEETTEKAAEAAETAQEVAEESARAAEASKTDAETAAALAEEAKSETERLMAAAAEIEGRVGDQVILAENAKYAAESARKSADKYAGIAVGAAEAAEAAQAAAETAKSGAESAKNAAQTARTGADSAKTAAQAARSKAEAAQAAAEKARDEAVEAAENAGTGGGEGGGEGGGAFIATYGVTTFAEITTAVAEGKVVFMDYGPPVETYRYQLQTYSAMYGICIFTSVHSSGGIFVAMVESNGKWSNYTVDVGGGGGSETELFVAEYGATTYQEVLEAANAGKVVIVEYVTNQYGRRMYYLSEIDDATGSLQFNAQGDAGTAYKIYLTTSGWSVSEEKISSVISVNGVEADKKGNVTLNFEVEKQEIVAAVLANFIDASEVGM